MFGNVVQYGNRFDLDYRLLTAQGYQESRLDPKARNPSGAVGIMQIKPSTAAGPPISIRNVHHVENNIHAGAKYIRFIIDQYYRDEAMSELDKMLFAFASYNAGPSRIDRVREKAARQGLDPNVWIGSVDLVAAREIGQEPVQFKPGEIGATVKGRIKGEQIVDYTLRAKARQTLVVILESSNRSCYFNVTAPGEDSAMFAGSTSGSPFVGEAPKDGEYIVRLYLMRNAARRLEGACRSRSPDFGLGRLANSWLLRG